MEVSTFFEAGTCKNCGKKISGDHQYCANCNPALTMPEKVITPFEHPVLLSIIIFYFLDLVACLAVKSYSYFDDYRHRVWIEIIMAGITLVFAILNRKELLKLYNVRQVKWYRLAFIIPLTVAASFAVSFIIHRLNIAFFGKDGLYFYGYNTVSHPVVVMLISMSLYPAIFEEMAFRGFLFNYFEKLFPTKTVIIITAILFSILHLSFIALIWLFPLALLLGYLRSRYNTLWYGMVIHFVFNLTACLIELHQLGML